MRILHIRPSSRLDSPPLPEALGYLGHQVERESIDRMRRRNSRNSRTEPASSVQSDSDIDLVLADATVDLSVAPSIAADVKAAGIDAPIIVVLSEGGLATAAAKWNVTDIIVSTAGPAEIEARMRLARDRFADRSQDRGTAARLARYDRSESASSSWPDATGSEVVVVGDLRIDETSFTADLGRRSLDLTYREFSLLKFFATNPERVFTRDEILLGVWGNDYYGGTRTVDVHVRRLRAKLGQDLENSIYTVRNVGYRFSPPREDHDESNADDGPHDAADNDQNDEEPDEEVNR